VRDDDSRVIFRVEWPCETAALHFCSALSLLLCLAAAALWVWSYRQPVWSMAVSTSPTVICRREIGMGNGYAGVAVSETWPVPPGMGAGVPYGGSSTGWSVPGLRYRDERITLMRSDVRPIIAIVGRTRRFTLWLGLPLIVSAILPILWLIRQVREKRKKQEGMCRVCGYDLRGSTERCPECGTAVSQADAAAR
jgi:hypothetical protein